MTQIGLWSTGRRDAEEREGAELLAAIGFVHTADEVGKVRAAERLNGRAKCPE